MSRNYELYSRGVAGFVVANLLCRVVAGKYEGHLIGRSIFISNFHVHHWIVGLVGLVIVLLVEQKLSITPVTSFLKGFMIGLLFEGLIFYNDYFTFTK